MVQQQQPLSERGKNQGDCCGLSEKAARVHHPHPLLINGTAVERVSSIKVLGVHITENLNWSTNTTARVKKAKQRLYFLQRLRKVNTLFHHAPPHETITKYLSGF